MQRSLLRNIGRLGPLGGFAVLGLLVALVAGGSMLLVGNLNRSPDPEDAGNGTPLPVRSAPPLERSWYASAVYLSAMLKNAPDPAAAMAATGQKTFALAFILAQNGNCTAAWDGRQSVATDSRVAAAVDTIRDHDGDVLVAFGGGSGTKLGQVCADAESTAAAYQAVLDRYHVRAVDFDLEGAEWRDPDAVRRELGAAAILVRDNPGLYVSVTMPAIPDRVPALAMQLVEIAREIPFVPDNYTLMPFDFHGTDPMGPAAIDSVEAMHDYLMGVYGWDTWDAYRHVGVSLMNGRTDHGEHYLQSDFETVLAYAMEKRLGRFTYWSLNRDRVCNPVDNNGKTSGNCSSVDQASFEFARYTARFAAAAGAAPTARPSASATASTSARPVGKPSPKATRTR